MNGPNGVPVPAFGLGLAHSADPDPPPILLPDRYVSQMLREVYIVTIAEIMFRVRPHPLNGIWPRAMRQFALGIYRNEANTGFLILARRRTDRRNFSLEVNGATIIFQQWHGASPLAD